MVRVLTGDEARDPRLVDLLVQTVNAGASIGFLAPITDAEASSYWESWAAEVESGRRVVLATEELTGCVHLALVSQPNGRHRAEVQKVLVHPSARRQGLGRDLVTAAEQHAAAIGRSLLVLDTEQGSAGERLYASCGWQRVGPIPGFALDSSGSQLMPTVVFYKQVTT